MFGPTLAGIVARVGYFMLFHFIVVPVLLLVSLIFIWLIYGCLWLIFIHFQVDVDTHLWYLR